MIPNRLSYKTLIGVKDTPNDPSMAIHRMTNNGYVIVDIKPVGIVIFNDKFYVCVIIGYYMEDDNES